jgi:uncharacterized OsmC-like protein
MDAATLRALQAPLKARFKDDPASAKATLHAEGSVGTDAITFRVETGVGKVVAGLHPMTGGDGADACSGDMLLEAIASCAGVTLKSVATALGIALRSARVRVEGDLDFRGTLGVSREAPVGFTDIRMMFTIDADAAPEQLAKLVELTERYCVVLQTLRTPPRISVSRG